MKLTKRQAALAIVTLLLAQSAESWPGPALDLDKLTADASFVAIGQIASVREVEKTTVQLGNGTVPARAMVAEHLPPHQ